MTIGAPFINDEQYPPEGTIDTLRDNEEYVLSPPSKKHRDNLYGQNEEQNFVRRSTRNLTLNKKKKKNTITSRSRRTGGSTKFWTLEEVNRLTDYMNQLGDNFVKRINDFTQFFPGRSSKAIVRKIERMRTNGVTFTNYSTTTTDETDVNPFEPNEEREQQQNVIVPRTVFRDEDGYATFIISESGDFVPEEYDNSDSETDEEEQGLIQQVVSEFANSSRDETQPSLDITPFLSQQQQQQQQQQEEEEEEENQLSTSASDQTYSNEEFARIMGVLNRPDRNLAFSLNENLEVENLFSRIPGCEVKLVEDGESKKIIIELSGFKQ